MSIQHASLKEKIRAEKIARRSRYAAFEDLYTKADAAGHAAGLAAVPVPMVVHNGSIRINGTPLNPAQADSAIIDVVADGACGFAWVVVRPGNSSFATWAKKHRNARKEYGGGVCVCWVSQFNQSMTRKEAYARAFAEVLREAGIKAYAKSRMD